MCHFKCKIKKVLTNVYICVTTGTAKIKNIFNNPKSSLVSPSSQCAHPPPASGIHSFVFCHYRLALSFLVLFIAGFIQYILFCVWFP